MNRPFEEIFGWMKTVGGFRRTRFRGLARTGLAGYFVAAAYKLVRIARLMQIGAGELIPTRRVRGLAATHWPHPPSS